FSNHHLVGYLFLFAVLAAATSVIYYWQTVKQIPVTTEPLLHRDPTANWKTYTNEQYGYQFKYPPTLYTNDEERVFWMNSSNLTIADGGGALPEGIEGKDWVHGYEIFVFKREVKNVDLISKGEYQVRKLNLNKLEAYQISGDVPSSGPDISIRNPENLNSYIEVGYNNGL